MSPKTRIRGLHCRVARGEGRTTHPLLPLLRRACVAAEEIDFPSHYPSRRFVLDQPQIGIGRHSPTRGTRPEIDLSGAPEDPAISRLHAILLRQDDGSYALMDPGSSNGTTLNDDPTPIAPNTPGRRWRGVRHQRG